MNVKRGGALFVSLFLLAVLFISPFVSAATDLSYLVNSIVQGVVDVGSPIFSALFGMYYTDEFLFIKVLLFILLFVLVRAGAKATPLFEKNHMLSNIVSLVVSLFAVRYISEGDLINGILLPYGTLGVAITVLAPFGLFFFLVEKTGKSSGWRKGAWMVYFFIMLVLWISRRDKISTEATYIYLGVLAICAILFFFDKSVQKYFDRRATNQQTADLIQDEINQEKVRYQTAMVANDSKSMDRHLSRIKSLEEKKHRWT